MKSGEPMPTYDLKLILDKKRNMASETCEVVSDAARWLKSQLMGSNVVFQYGACDFEDHYGYSIIIIVRKTESARLILEIKIAEIASKPFLFAEVRSLGRATGSLFPFFGEIASEEGRELALHYISDYILSTLPEDGHRESTEPES